MPKVQRERGVLLTSGHLAVFVMSPIIFVKLNGLS